MTVYLEVTRDDDNGGFLYVAYIEEGLEFFVLGSGQEDTLDGAFRQLKGITERTI